MAQGAFFQIKEITHESIVNCHKFVDQQVSRLMGDGKVAVVKVEEYKDPRSLKANAMYWVWLREIAKYLTDGGRSTTDKRLHKLMKHEYLGYEPSETIGGVVIPAMLRSTADLDSSAMCFYMQKVDAWSADMGFLVPTPNDSEYRQYLDKQVQ